MWEKFLAEIMANPQVTAAMIAATVAALASILTFGTQITFRLLDSQADKKKSIMEKRQEALLRALQVVDHVYANSDFDGKIATNPHEWDITEARNAMNLMILYCKKPNLAVDAFSRAVGLHNPATDFPRPYGPKDLAAFRRVICSELELPETDYLNEDLVWIASLPGAFSVSDKLNRGLSVR